MRKSTKMISLPSKTGNLVSHQARYRLGVFLDHWVLGPAENIQQASESCHNRQEHPLLTVMPPDWQYG